MVEPATKISVGHPRNTAVFPLKQLFTYAVRGTVIGGVYHLLAAAASFRPLLCVASFREEVCAGASKLVVRGLRDLRVFPVEQELLWDLGRR